MEQDKHTLSSTRDLSGTRIGTCLLERMIGRGGMGEVYLARQERLGRYVAVKTLRAHFARDADTAQQFQMRFQREARLIALLDHVNITPIYEYGEQEGVGYLVMPYLTGGSVRDLLHRQGSLSPLQALIYLEQAAQALDYAHEQGVIHRDLKPANFLLHADGRLVLADFGIARILAKDDQKSPDVTLTGTGVLLGTPEYMAPEMVRGEVPDKRADIYELGIVLYQMLSGSAPFQNTTPLLVAVMHLQQPIPSLHASHPAIPAAVDTVLQVATAKLPAERFQTAGALAQAFREVIRPSGLSPSDTGMDAPTFPAQRNILTHTPETPPPLAAPSDARSLPAQPPSSSAFPESSIGSSASVTAPQTPYPPLRTLPGQSRRQPWVVLLGIAMIAILVVGGILIGLQLNHNNANPVSHQQTSPTVTQTDAGTTAVPSPATLLQKGFVLYTTNAPGASTTNGACDGGNEQWAGYNLPAITCQPGHVTLHNPQQALAGILLVALPDHAPYPANYVVEAGIQEDPSSQADFGLYFRNQPGNAQGIYTFLIHTDGSWASYVYDNATGAPTQIGSGSAGVYAHAQLTLDVVANGSSYIFYVNGQHVGQASDTTYHNGTAGIVVDAGGTIVLSSFALYTLA